MALKEYKCPNCGYEYESWVEVCPDCNVPVTYLASEPSDEHSQGPIAPDGGSPQWAVAANVPNAIIGSLIKSQLEDAGIPVLMMRSRSADIAEFSHNDYVAQDIRVPEHLREQARQLIYATPDILPFAAESYDDEPEDEDSASSAESAQGWSLLPGEADMRSRREMIVGRGETPAGWYWSDDQPTGYADDQPGPSHEEAPARPQRSTGPYRVNTPSAREEFDEEEEWPRQQKWVRILYGIMLLAISLPFLLQIFEQLARLFGR